MNTATASFIAASALVLTGLPNACIHAASEAPHEDFPIGFLPLDRVVSVLKKTISPTGHYVVLMSDANVRVYDSVEKLQEEKRALEALQNAPATLSIQLTVRAGARRITRQQYPAEEPVLSYEVPIPQSYGPAQIIPRPGGGVTVVPGLPRDFTTRRVEPGTTVNTCPTGYVTRTPEIRLSETSLEGGVVRKLSGSAALGKPVAITVLRKVPDAGALRDWALRQGLIATNEPAWTSAGTEFLAASSISNGYLSLQAVPQIVAYSDGARQSVHRIPVSKLAANFLAQRNTPMPVQVELPGDSEFYGLFFGVRETGADALTLMSLTTGVQYIPQAGQ